MKTIFKILMIIIVDVMLLAAIWMNVQVYKYGEAMYKKGYTEAEEYCLQLKRY